MAKVLNNGELAALLTQALTQPDHPLTETTEQFVNFTRDIATVLANYANVNMIDVGPNDEPNVEYTDQYFITFVRNEDSEEGDPAEAIFDDFDEDGEL